MLFIKKVNNLTLKHLLLTTIATVVLVGCGPRMSIHEGARNGNIEAVKQHLAAGTNVNAKDEYSGYTSLHRAANHDLNEIAKLLIKKGANVNLKADFGYTPLMLATNTAIAELLIKNGANVNATHQYGTVFHIAAGVENRSVTRWFMDNGADVNAKDDNGNTPLDWIDVDDVYSKEIADLLRKHGAKTG